MMIVVLISYGRGRFSANEEEVVDNVRQFQLLPHARCGGGSKLNPCKRNVEHCCPSFQKLIWVVHLVVMDVMASSPERTRMMTREAVLVLGLHMCHSNALASNFRAWLTCARGGYTSLTFRLGAVGRKGAGS